MGIRTFRNTRGSGLITAVVVAGVIAAAAATIFKNFNLAKESFRMARVKNLITTVETQVRRRALQPEAYLGCTSSGAASCVVNQAFFADLRHQLVYGAACQPGVVGCGIALTAPTFDPVSKNFRAVISYEGREVKPKPVDLVVPVPIELLQAESFHCGHIDSKKPVFTGFDPSSGQPICKGFNECGAGEYVHQVNVSRRTVTCRPLPASVACGNQQLIATFDWNGGNVTSSCGGLPDPPFNGSVTVSSVSNTTVTNTSTATQTLTNTDTHVEPPPPEPPPTPTIWTWQGVRYTTTCTGGGCDAVEWAACSGPGCSRSSVDCYCVYPTGCHAAGSTQTSAPAGLCFY